MKRVIQYLYLPILVVICALSGCGKFGAINCRWVIPVTKCQGTNVMGTKERICLDDKNLLDNEQVSIAGFGHIESGIYNVGELRNSIKLGTPIEPSCNSSAGSGNNSGPGFPDNSPTPYLISRIPNYCSPPNNFRLDASIGYVLVEDCDATYYFDSYNSLNGKVEKGREIFLKFYIPEYDPDLNYGLYIYDNSATPIFSNPVDYNSNNENIVYREPDLETNVVSPFLGTMRVKLPLKVEFNAYEKNFTIKIQTYTEDILNPGPLIADLTSTFKVKNRYTYLPTYPTYSSPLTTVYRTSFFPITLYNNSGTTFRGNIKDYKADYDGSSSSKSFESAFSHVFGRSGIIASYLPNYSAILIQPTPQNTILPKFLVDANGNAVLFQSDVNETNQLPIDDMYNEITLKWHIRIEYYNSMVREGREKEVSTLEALQEKMKTEPNRKYNNSAGLVVINSFFIYNNDLSVPATPIELKKGITMDAYRKDESHLPLFRGSTVGAADKNYYNPFCVIDRGAIEIECPSYKNKKDILDLITISVGMHELAHAWYSNGVINKKLAGTSSEQHAAYVKGSNEKYCLMRNRPKGYETTAIDAFTNEKFLYNRAKQMTFSDGIEQRLMNVFIISY